MSNLSVYAKTKFILKMIDNIKRIIQKHGGIVKALEDELEAQPAILMALLQIGESLNKIDKEEHDIDEELFLVSVYFTNKESQNIFETNYSFLLNGTTPILVEKVERDDENYKNLMLKNSWGNYYLVKFNSQDTYNLNLKLTNKSSSAQLNFEK